MINRKNLKIAVMLILLCCLLFGTENSMRTLKATGYRVLAAQDENSEPLPVNDDGSLGTVSKGTLYSMSNFKQWIALANYSKENDLSGYRFSFSLNYSDANNSSPTYDFTTLNPAFPGLGSESHPFAGELFTTYTAGTITFKMNTPLFTYLSSKAVINGVRVETSGTCAGLAEYLVSDSSDMKTDLTNITVVESGSDTGINGEFAGGLFAHVINDIDETLTIQGENVAVSSVVSGKTAGGLIGELQGNVTIDFDGISFETRATDGSTVYSYTTASGDNAVAVGGIIGSINTVPKKAVNAQVTLKCSKPVVYTHRAKEFQGNANKSGGIIGSISNADVYVNCPLEYAGGNSDKEIIGINAGAFAGNIEQSKIILNNQISIKDAAICLTDAAGSNTSCNAGLFAGAVRETQIVIGNEWAGSETLDAFVTSNSNNDRINVKSLSNSRSDNVGGFIGATYNSDMEFTTEHPCKIGSFKTDNTRGNVSAGIGNYEVNGKNGNIQYISITGNTRLIGKNSTPAVDATIKSKGTVGGIAGYVGMTNGNVTISNCGATCPSGASLYVSATTIPYLSVGVGAVEARVNPDSKLILDSINLQVCLRDYAHGSHFRIEAFGGAIGLAAADIEIKGTNTCKLVENVFTCKDCKTACCGGVIGKISNQNSDRRRKVSIENVTVGLCPFTAITTAKGGFVGYVEENTAVQFSGDLIDNIITNDKMYYSQVENPYVGSVVGAIDNSLIYMEEGCNFEPNTYGPANEIGNYGGVIRNKNWDNDDINGTKLIENYGVTGTLTNNIATVGDMMRFAIAMNTQGVFMPLGNNENAQIKNIDDVCRASYSLTCASYDLSKTGLVCLARNDDKGIEETPFQGSLSGIGEKSTIKYAITSSNQKYIGLFPNIKGDTTTCTFENLILNYELIYKTYKAKQTNYNSPTDIVPSMENAGGLSAIASGNININNVSYTGTITDVNNSVWDNTNKRYNDKKDDYLGGIIGRYIGKSGKTISIDNLTAKMALEYHDVSHVMGGVIGYVDLDGVTTGTPCNINIGNADNSINLSGSISAAITNPTSVTTLSYALREGGLIAVIGSEDDDNYENKCRLIINGLNAEDISITADDKKNYSETGGFLGYRWADVDVSLNNVNIGRSKAAILEAKAAFGSMIHTVIGKMLVDNTNIGPNTKLSAKNGTDINGENIDNCGLLVRNGQKLYLDVRNYNVETGVKLCDYDGKYFDELVGFTKGGDDIYHGGIVTIGYNEADKYYLGRNGCEYKSYESGHVVDGSGARVDKPNPKTRYYYDLNKLTWQEAEDYSELSDADDVMSWNLLHYANSDVVKAMCKRSITVPKTYIVNNTINLSGYSVYPVFSENETYTGNSGELVFYAQGIINGESNKMNTGTNQMKYPEDDSCQHAGMQAGLFDDVSGLTVKDLTLSGTYSIIHSDTGNKTAGALISGSINGVPDGKDANGKTLYKTTILNKFNNINLNNLWCVSKDSIDYDAPIGLMIYDISSGAQVSFDGISMSGYSDASVEGDTTGSLDDKKAASALIGNVGGNTATYISISFINMDIADAAAGESDISLHSSKQDEALAKASFIYSYDYMENCNGIYTFTYDDYKDGRCTTPPVKKITLGLELGNSNTDPNYALEEYYDIDLPVGRMHNDDSGIEYNCNNYIPYVFVRTKNILVNPKAGSLLEGCGTYEDPYVISETKQMMTLYRYLYDEENFAGVFTVGEWKVNPIGDDSRLCNKTNNTQTGHGEAVLYANRQSDNFPTKEELSHAYYQITDDIDLSAYSEFTGFGRNDVPFVGVFVGKLKSDSSYPVITMSGLTNPVANYGFIQTTKGCVVKDIVLKYNRTIQINKEITVTENGNSVTRDEGGVAGGVIGTVLGGENLIDNVTVQGLDTNSYQCFEPKNTKAMIGGYVGEVRCGGVILRNVTTESLAYFDVALSQDETSDKYIKNYWYTCGIIGRVYDGYVVHDSNPDGSGAENEPLFRKLTGVYSSDGRVISANGQSRSYEIVNGAYLKQGGGKISWQPKSGTANAKFTISDAKQLQVISMALNSGMFNYDKSVDTGIGYNKISRQRCGDYDYVGNTHDGNGVSARSEVIRSDNMNKASDMLYRSYLSQFFDWNGNSIIKVDNNGTFNGTNAVAVLNPISEIVTYELTGAEYNMSVFGSAFRGLGSRYFKEEGKYYNNIFHGNLVGCDSKSLITLNMYADGIQDAEDVALLNRIKLKTAQELSVKNITLTGIIINKSDVGVSLSDSIDDHYAAGFVTRAENAELTFENVLLNQLQVKSQNYAAGMVGYNTGNPIVFTGCGITGQSEIPEVPEVTDEMMCKFDLLKNINRTVIVGRSDVGGFIGKTETKATVKDISKLDHLYVGSYAMKLNQKNQNKGSGGNAGGLIGDAVGPEMNGKSDNLQPFGENISVVTNGSNVGVGGLVGQTQSGSSTFKDILLTDLTVKNIFQGPHDSNKDLVGTGGIVGSAGNITMENVTVGSTSQGQKVEILNTDSYTDGNDKIQTLNTFGVGGLVGRHVSGNLNLTNCSLLGYRGEDGSYTTRISGRGSNIAGIAGNGYKVIGTGICVKGVAIEATRYAAGVISWFEKDECTLNDVLVKDVKITLSCKSSDADRGDVGGIAAHLGGNLNLNGAIVDSLIVESDNSNNVGGYVGYSKDKNFKVSTYVKSGVTINNSVTNCFLGGKIIGGVVGYITQGENILNNITVSNNKLVANREDDNKDSKNMAVGGLIGYAYTTNASKHIISENITIKDNLVSAYYVKDDLNNTMSNLARLGGVIGRNNFESNFYNVSLIDNYIGVMNKEELSEDRKAFLLNTPIDGENGLRDYLYCISGSTKQFNVKITDLHDNDGEQEYYKYSYFQGAVVGVVDNMVGSGNAGISKFVKVNVSYTDPKYRPVSDVGASSTSLASNTAMYEEYRKKCVIVYDGYLLENGTGSIAENVTPYIYTKLPGLDTSSVADTPYVFANIEYIMNDYSSAMKYGKRIAYRLEDNYVAGRTINRDTSVTNYEKINATDVFAGTYKSKDGYKSPFKTNDGVLPMVVYNSADCGNLDEVLQTYINILTNNSGALNSYVDYSKDTTAISTVVGVTTYKVNFSNGQVSDVSTEGASVTATPTKSGNIVTYEFTTSQGDDFVSESEGTFTLVRVEYGYKKGSSAKQVKYVVDIPVYVEKRLKVYSNMKLIEGIQYNTETIKQNGQCVLKEIPENGERSPITLTRGYSYSIYTEYVYADYEKFAEVKIPKSFCITTINESNINFSPGTKITLVALDEGCKPYYYQVGEDIREIAFTEFKAADGSKYELKDIKSYTPDGDKTDVCEEQYENDIVRERYVLLVDTSGTSDANSENRLYEMHILPNGISENMKNRTDYYEHCFEYINEIPGSTYKINTATNENGKLNTYLDATSKISRDGSAKVHLQYDVVASSDYWLSIKLSNYKQYLDVGFYLEAVASDGSVSRLPLPQGTGIKLGTGENQVIVPAADGQQIVYYYQTMRKQQSEAEAENTICINDLEQNTSNQLDIAFDFSNADMSDFNSYSDYQFYVGAELIVTTDKDMSASGLVKDTWKSSVDMQIKDDIGFALNTDEIMTLGMNQYEPEESDSGVVCYTASIALPNTDKVNLASKDYKIVYQIEEKTSQKGGNNKPEYQIYTGNDISLYLGTFDNVNAAKGAMNQPDTVASGRGITSVTYHFTEDDINSIIENGMNLYGGVSESGTDRVPGVVKAHCTLVANCENLNMTNYRVKAYLIVTDSEDGSNMSGKVKTATVRSGSWAKAAIGPDTQDIKNDFFVFTVAKIKKSMK